MKIHQHLSRDGDSLDRLYVSSWSLTKRRRRSPCLVVFPLVDRRFLRGNDIKLAAVVEGWGRIEEETTGLESRARFAIPPAATLPPATSVLTLDNLIHVFETAGAEDEAVTSVGSVLMGGGRWGKGRGQRGVRC